jgi:predicted DNA-binding protein
VPESRLQNWSVLVIALAWDCFWRVSDTHWNACISAVPPVIFPMSDRRGDRSNKNRRRVGRPPAGAKVGEKVKDYPQLSIRVPQEMKARLNAVSAVTGLAQWRVVVEAINCFVHDLPLEDRELVEGLSARLIRAGT